MPHPSSSQLSVNLSLSPLPSRLIGAYALMNADRSRPDTMQSPIIVVFIFMAVNYIRGNSGGQPVVRSQHMFLFIQVCVFLSHPSNTPLTALSEPYGTNQRKTDISLCCPSFYFPSVISERSHTYICNILYVCGEHSPLVREIRF